MYKSSKNSFNEFGIGTSSAIHFNRNGFRSAHKDRPSQNGVNFPHATWSIMEE